MNGSQNITAAYISLIGGFLTSLFFVKYGPSIARRAKRRNVTSDEKIILALQRSIKKRDRTIQYLRLKSEKAKQRQDRLLAIDQKLAAQNEEEYRYIQELQRQLQSKTTPDSEAVQNTNR